MFIDCAGEQIVKLSYKSGNYVDLSESACTSTSDANSALDNLPSSVNEMPEMFSSMASNGYDTDELCTLKIPPQEPFAHTKSPDRIRYLEDLRNLRAQCDMEFCLENVNSFHIGSVQEWEDDSIRSWLYVFRDEKATDRQGSQDARWLKFSHKLFNVYGVDKSPTECMREVMSYNHILHLPKLYRCFFSSLNRCQMTF